ncbi:hypothetical protein I3843_15G013800 [Carya illinoinensis]|uniref:Alginate lyase 2 domain-containing protein n=1 Tax=Carya illinoinensis TaxID=32201 RepID=A0A8T1N6Q7_CARIL|nr:hypothetical protein I3760_15G014200 [Carya illinoinensis]KAG6625985.1 hypothetical protein CIPAW_15G015300 [Carya illinoinensis]KAG6673915.1 hypothetical protein I3842_15G014900 [Carya illinoinensis]KAG7942953.1 hypothetical protein I3843_15G013800 [Carya illinoinensis]
MKTSVCCSILVVLILVSFLENGHLCVADPTDGFTPVPLTDANFKLQKPYDIPLEDRYSYKDGVHRFWVYNKDKPFKPDSTTRPRTEIRISHYWLLIAVGLVLVNILSTLPVWKFKGYTFVPSGTSGVSIMQIHGATMGATTLQLRMYKLGDIRYYRCSLVAADLYHRWVRVNVIHDVVDKGKVTVFIDGVKKFVVKDQGPGNLYFKCGVYAAPFGSSNYMESRCRGIKLFKK